MTLSLGIGLGLTMQRLSQAGEFSPLSLYEGGADGAWYDPSDLTTMWHDIAKTVKVTGTGQPIGLIEDKSGNGYHLGQPGTNNKPLYRTDGTYHWMEFDGSNDFLQPVTTTPMGIATCVVATDISSSADIYSGIISNSTVTANIDTVFAIENTDWLISQGAGGTLSNATHIWNNQTQTTGITYDTPVVYSADGTGQAISPIVHTQGIMLGTDRKIASRYLLGNIYGVITAGDDLASILSDTDRNAAEAWLAAKAGVTL